MKLAEFKKWFDGYVESAQYTHISETFVIQQIRRQLELVEPDIHIQYMDYAGEGNFAGTRIPGGPVKKY